MHILKLNLFGIHFYRVKGNWNHMLLFVFTAKKTVLHMHIWKYKIHLIWIYIYVSMHTHIYVYVGYHST